MADFRKLIYALALVAMVAGLTVPVSAQAQPFQCIANAGVPPIVRGEGYAELTGDLTLNCAGGIPTVTGQVVPQVNFTILLNTNITSKLLGTTGLGFNEALLIVDEPHSAVNPLRPMLNCAATGAPDNGPSGPGVCSIVSVGNPAITYDGTAGTAVYGTGRPNVFQGRTGTVQNPGQYNAVTWLGVPLDPPGTTTNRTLRFTNIRADAVFLGVSSTFTTNYVQAQISVNGNTSLSINNPQQIVAFVQKGLIVNNGSVGVGGTNAAACPPATPALAGCITGSGAVSFLQCTSTNAAAVAAGGGVLGSATLSLNAPATPTFTFTEGFASSWKAKNIAMITNQTGNGTILAGSSYWSYVLGSTKYPSDQNQNVPGAIYNTESGFENIGPAADPAAPNNPPQGVGSTAVASTAAFSNATSGTGIAGAGIATQGTRLAVQITSIPNGSVVFVPQAVYLTNGSTINGGISGIAVLTTTDAAGAGTFTPPATAASPSTYSQLQASGLAVYEVLFADPFSIESMSVPLIVGFATNLAQNLPQPTVTAQAAGSFAPFYSTSTAHNPSATLPVPRFVPGLTPVNIFSILKCACDILFPWVVSQGGFDTGIALANTSLDPGAAFGFNAAPQSGAVQFWYYGSGSGTGGAAPSTQCTNTTSPGTCPGTTVVPAGQVLTYVVSQGSTQWGLDNRGAGFAGYVIAQSAFQYCHAFAYISALGAGPLTVGVSEGYTALILDAGTPALGRTRQSAESLGN
jgi:hypothetical protein